MNPYRMHYPVFDLDDYSDPYFVESLSGSRSLAFGRGNWGLLEEEDEEENLLRLSNSILKNVGRDSSPPKSRHDGTSPLPLGMDWSPPPLNWDGPKTVWPHDFHSGWSYCATIPSWSILFGPGGSKPVVFYRVQVGLQSPQGVTTTHETPRRFSDFLKLSSELKQSFRHKKLPPAPQKSYMRMKNGLHIEERRSALEEWIFKLLSDIDLSRSAAVACFLELEAAARLSFREQSHASPDADLVSNSDNVATPLSETAAVDPPSVNESRSGSALAETICSENERDLIVKCLDLESKLKAEEETKTRVMKQNEALVKQLQDLQISHENAKTDIKLLTEEIETLKRSSF